MLPVPDQGAIARLPDLAVEVRSPGDVLPLARLFGSL